MTEHEKKRKKKETTIPSEWKLTDAQKKFIEDIYTPIDSQTLKTIKKTLPHDKK